MAKYRSLAHAFCTLLGIVVFAGLLAPVTAQAADETDLRVVVTDADTGEPLYQAHLTLQFTIERRMRKDIHRSYTAKTDKNGRCRFRHIPKGTIHLIVTDEHHQTFGKDYDIEQDNPVIEVKLRKPQPLV